MVQQVGNQQLEKICCPVDGRGGPNPLPCTIKTKTKMKRLILLLFPLGSLIIEACPPPTGHLVVDIQAMWNPIEYNTLLTELWNLKK